MVQAFIKFSQGKLIKANEHGNPTWNEQAYPESFNGGVALFIVSKDAPRDSFIIRLRPLLDRKTQWPSPRRP